MDKPPPNQQPPHAALPPTADLNERKRRAVELRLDGVKLSDVAALVGLSSPTIINAQKAFREGGWKAIEARPRGRTRGAGKMGIKLKSDTRQKLLELKPEQLFADPADNGSSTPDTEQLWSNELLIKWLSETSAVNVTARTATRYTSEWGLLPPKTQQAIRQSENPADRQWWQKDYVQFRQRASTAGRGVFWIGVRRVANEVTDTDNTRTGLQHYQFYAHSLRSRLVWHITLGMPALDDYQNFFSRLQASQTKPLALVVDGIEIAGLPELERWMISADLIWLGTPQSRPRSAGTAKSAASPESAAALESTSTRSNQRNESPNTIASRDNRMNSSTNSLSANAEEPLEAAGTTGPETGSTPGSHPNRLTHLQKLEAESLHIMREVVAEAENPVMLYSIGKDSAVMLHLAMKAFYPAKPPFPLLHVDTTWKFKAMYEFRDQTVKQHGLELLTYTNPEGVEKGVNPFSHGSALHTDIMKTEALKQALDKYGFDMAFGGARRDEEKSRAKERVFSFRTSQHRWDPKAQRPELWNIYNTRKQNGESIRAFPLSNWTELDIWQYIHLEKIPVVPLYFSAKRPVVERDGSLIMVDDERMPLQPGEVPMMRDVRFRTLGCYPLTGAIESSATTLPEVIAEMLLSRTSERQGRMIDHDSSASMEKKKQEGYF